MASLKDSALNYSSATTMNIADLDKVSTDLDLVPDSFEVDENGEKKTVYQEIIIIEDQKYRVPKTVLQQLKVLLEDNPQMKFFKVKKTGSHMDTRYTVIPVSN